MNIQTAPQKIENQYFVQIPLHVERQLDALSRSARRTYVALLNMYATDNRRKNWTTKASLIADEIGRIYEVKPAKKTTQAAMQALKKAGLISVIWAKDKNDRYRVLFCQLTQKQAEKQPRALHLVKSSEQGQTKVPSRFRRIEEKTGHPSPKTEHPPLPENRAPIAETKINHTTPKPPIDPKSVQLEKNKHGGEFKNLQKLFDASPQQVKAALKKAQEANPTLELNLIAERLAHHGERSAVPRGINAPLFYFAAQDLGKAPRPQQRPKIFSTRRALAKSRFEIGKSASSSAGAHT